MEKLYKLGFKKEKGVLWFHYVKGEPDGTLGVYRFRHNQKSEKLCNTPIKRDPNLLSWHFIKADENDDLWLCRTLRTTNLPGEKRKWVKKSEKRKQVIIDLRQPLENLSAT